MAVGTYKNEVVEELVNEFLTTYLDLEGFCAVDNSLQAQDGDTVKVYTYTLSGQADKVTEGYGNTHTVSIAGAYETKTVAMAQAKTSYTDEEVYRNPLLVDEKMKGCAKAIANLETADITGEWNKCTNQVLSVDATNSSDYFDQLMEAEALLATDLDNKAYGQRFCICSPAYWKNFKKSLRDNTLVEYDIINGKKYPVIGGIPFKVSSAIANLERTVGSGESAKDYDVDAFLIDTTAVKVLRGKSVSAEQSRNSDTRTTDWYNRDNYVAWLEYADRAVALVTEQAAV